MHGFGASRLTVVIAMLVMLAGPLGLGGVLHSLHHHHAPVTADAALDCGPGCVDPDHHHEPSRVTPKCPICTSSPTPVVVAISSQQVLDTADLDEIETSHAVLLPSSPLSIWLIRAPPALSHA